MYDLFEFRNRNVAMVKGSERLAVAEPDGRNAHVIFRDKRLDKDDVRSFFLRHFNRVTFKY